MIFKCKMCGGTVEFEPGASTGICDSCGTKQTLPRLDDDKRANLYDRANHFRRNNDFDKAMAIYEQILNEDNTDAEAYWSLVLCRYGIEYVEDPQSRKRIPTVNRAQFTSIYMDEDYKSALQYADGYQKTIYEEEAKAIDDIQKGILEISSKEDPFDVFICYKETDANGRRTPDSVLANDLYHQLTQEGFKVFFARITLEDKLGSAYEPYIFAALNSAKVMVVLGTKPEYFNAVWVRNEWSRYLALVKKSGGKRILIPAYKDMDPYDLPEEFSHLQAQDMSKLGFMQDLIRGIKKIVAVDTATTQVNQSVLRNETSNTTPLLKRASLFLEDGAWKEAGEYFEKVLDLDPECGEAYVGKIMCDLHVKKREDLKDCPRPFDNDSNYQKAIRFGSPELKSEIIGYIDAIKERNWAHVYDDAIKLKRSADSEKKFKEAALIFETMNGFRDSDSLAVICRKESMYYAAKAEMSIGNAESYQSAIDIFAQIPGWKDADKQTEICRKRIEEIAEAEQRSAERERRRKRKRQCIAVLACIAAIIFLIMYALIKLWMIPTIKYHKAVGLKEDGKYDEAIAAFTELGDYRDSKALIYDCYIGKYGRESASFIQNLKIGNTVAFGSYEQDNDLSNGKEPIEWVVLKLNDTRALLISKVGLAYKEYDIVGYNNATPWKDCSLRQWLNEEFADEAFTDEKLSAIQETSNNTDGNITYDKVFLLDSDEVNEYFPSAESKKCSPSRYAAEQKSTIVVSEWWWLRSPSSCVSRSGLVSSRDIVTNTIMVRPAIWVDIASVIDASKLLPDDSTDASQGESSGASQEESDDQSENIKIGDVSIGDTVFIGEYEQDNDLTNGKEPIEWIVLKKTNDNRALLISKYALDRKQFNVSDSNVDWMNSSLYKWLNGEFMDEAFGKNEKSLIVHGSYCGRVFILKAEEIYLTGFGSKDPQFYYEKAKYIPTEYAKAKDGLDEGWLRDTKEGFSNACIIMENGQIYYGGLNVIEKCLVRPAIWVRLY